jgi:hypothetical protein
MSDGQIDLPNIGASAATNPGAGKWAQILDTENADTPTVLKGTASGPPIQIPLGLAVSVISPPALTGDVNDYAPTGLATAHIIRVDCGGVDRSITGLEAAGVPATALIKYIVNVGSAGNLTVEELDGGSIAANQFKLGGDITLAPGDSLAVFQSATVSKWEGL